MDRFNEAQRKALNDWVRTSPTLNSEFRYAPAGGQGLGDLLNSFGNVNDLGDVSADSPSNNQILKFNSTTNQWELGEDLVGLTEAPPFYLNDAQDVNAPAPSDGEVLKFNSSSGQWEPASDAIRDPFYLNDAQDVNVPAPGDGQVLKFIQANNRWEARDDTGASAFYLNDAQDVNAPAPSAGQVLKFDGSEWIPDTDLQGSDVFYLNDLRDVSAPAPSNGQVLKFNAANNQWEPAADNTGAGGGSDVFYINDLRDVNAPAPSDGNFLQFDAGSGQWIPATAGATITFKDGVNEHTSSELNFNGGRFYLSTDLNGDPVVNLIGLKVVETDDTPIYDDIIELGFNSADFYVTQNTQGKAIVNSRGVGLAGTEGAVQFNENGAHGANNAFRFIPAPTSGGQLAIPTPFAGGPTLIFDDGTSTFFDDGISGGANRINIFIQGDEVIRFQDAIVRILDGVQLNIVSAGSASAPSLEFAGISGGDPQNTGLFRDTADLGVAVTGVEKARFTDTQTIIKNTLNIRNGIIGFYLNESEDVSAPAPDDDQVLKYNSSTGQWEPAGALTVTDGSNTHEASELNFSDQNFYISTDLDGDPVVNLRLDDINLKENSAPAATDGGRLTFDADGTATQYIQGNRVPGFPSLDQLEFSSNFRHLHVLRGDFFGSASFSFILAGNTNASNAFLIHNNGASTTFFRVQANGFSAFNPSGAITANTVLDVNGSFAIRATTPATLAAGNNNNYAIGNAGALRLAAPGGGSTITGIAGGVNGRIVIIFNVSANSIVIANQSASSTAANRIITGSGANVTLAADDAVQLWYDSTTARWRMMNRSL